MSEKIVIPFDRLKYLKWFLISLAVTVSCWAIMMLASNFALIMLAALPLIPCAIVFSYSMQQVLRLGDGLRLTPDGFYDNSRGTRVGDVPWTAVHSVAEAIVFREQSLVVMVENPQHYVERGRTFYRLSKSNYLKNFGSPIAISAKKLKIETDELFTLFNQYYEKYGSLNE